MKLIILSTLVATLSSVGYSMPQFVYPQYPQASLNVQGFVPNLSGQSIPYVANSFFRTAQAPFVYANSYQVPAAVQAERSEYPTVKAVDAAVISAPGPQLRSEPVVVNPFEPTNFAVKQVDVAVRQVNLAEPTLVVEKPKPMFRAAVAPVAPINTPVISQFHAQDELGQYTYGYSGGPSSKIESRNALGVVHGGFSYVDPVGEIQSQTYIADQGGFRTAGTNIPVGPSN